MPNYHKLMNKARKTNRERDTIDHETGCAAPQEGTKGMLLRTAMCALQAGIASGDWNCVAEGQVMLEQLHFFLEGKPYKL